MRKHVARLVLTMAAMVGIGVIPMIAGAPPAAATPHFGSEDVYTPNYELFVGYSHLRAFPGRSAGNIIDWVSGGTTSFAFNKNRYLGLVADLGYYHANKVRTGTTASGGLVDASGNILTYMAGPRLSFRHNRFTPFTQALFGVAHSSAVMLNGCTGANCTLLPSGNAFAMTAGGGLDVTLNSRIALRLFQAEYTMTRFKEPISLTGPRGTQNDLRLSVGIVFRFGVKLR